MIVILTGLLLSESDIYCIPFPLQDKFPSVKISDIPGLETDGTLGTSANFLG